MKDNENRLKQQYNNISNDYLSGIHNKIHDIICY